MNKKTAERQQVESEPAAGKANCGCWYHAEQGIPCEHDLLLAASGEQE